MAKIRIEDVVFWILIFATIAVIIWKLFGSPSDIAVIIFIGTFIIFSEIMLWKNFFKIDKKTSLGFMKVEHDIEKFRIEVNNRFDIIDNKLNKILK